MKSFAGAAGWTQDGLRARHAGRRAFARRCLGAVLGCCLRDRASVREADRLDNGTLSDENSRSSNTSRAHARRRARLTTHRPRPADSARLLRAPRPNHQPATAPALRRHPNRTRTTRNAHRLRVLDRFRPPAPHGTGSSPYHWILDEAGAHVVAAQYGIARRELKWRHATALALADSPKLHHHIAINEFFAQLAQEAAASGGAFAEWYGERTIHGLFDGLVWPDGYGVLTLPDRAPLHLLLELDRAIEPAAQLRDKATRYAKAIPRSTLARHRPIVVLAVPNSARAQVAVAAVAGTGAPITVATWSPHAARSALAVVLDSSLPEATLGR
ncbi:MAG: replication-relaxation family protein [Solirubrobacteraceae bacterium]